MMLPATMSNADGSAPTTARALVAFEVRKIQSTNSNIRNALTLCVTWLLAFVAIYILYIGMLVILSKSLLR